MKKILILGGGFSKERTISLDTAQCVLKVLKKKGYKLFRNYPFIDREEEIKFLKEFFEDKPSRILFLYGPKSTGKTTLIEYVIENELFEDFKLFKSQKYNVKYINFRRKLIGN